PPLLLLLSTRNPFAGLIQEKPTQIEKKEPELIYTTALLQHASMNNNNEPLYAIFYVSHILHLYSMAIVHLQSQKPPHEYDQIKPEKLQPLYYHFHRMFYQLSSQSPE